MKTYSTNRNNKHFYPIPILLTGLKTHCLVLQVDVSATCRDAVPVLPPCVAWWTTYSQANRFPIRRRDHVIPQSEIQTEGINITINLFLFEVDKLLVDEHSGIMAGRWSVITHIRIFWNNISSKYQVFIHTEELQIQGR